MQPLGESDPTAIGQYRTFAELGRGGMGRVLLGSAPDGRLVAVKLVHAIFAEDPGFRARFRREVAASRKVAGAYTAPVIDADPDAPSPWLASAFVPGPALQLLIENGQTLPEQPALRLAAELAAACVGHSPFVGSSVPDTLRRIAYTEPELSGLPARVRQIAAACLAKAPDERPAPATLRIMIGKISPSGQPWPDGVHTLIADQRAEIDRLLDPTGAATAHQPLDPPTVFATKVDPDPLPEPPAQPPAAPPAEPPVDPPADRPAATSWPTERPAADKEVNWPGVLATLAAIAAFVLVVVFVIANGQHGGTDNTPFTEAALLPPTFTDDKGIEFALEAGGAKPCDQAASSDVVAELTGCTQMMTGTYLEQPGPYATPDNPVMVSVEVLAFPDSTTASNVEDYLNGNARWSLTLWCTPTGLGAKPCASTATRFHVSSNVASHRYVITAMSERTDLTTDGSIGPWLNSAAVAAATSCGPQNYQGD